VSACQIFTYFRPTLSNKTSNFSPTHSFPSPNFQFFPPFLPRNLKDLNFNPLNNQFSHSTPK